MSEPRQFRKDPAGGFCEDRLTESPLPLKVCPNPKCAGGRYYVGERCGACESHCGGSSDDVVLADDDADDTDLAPTQPEPPEMIDPPGGSD